MNFNKEILTKNFKEKKYSLCIEMLTDEIIRSLSESVKSKYPDFKYSNIKNLRNDCAKYLEQDKQEVAFKMHELLLNEEYPQKQLLTELLILYKKINNEK